MTNRINRYTILTLPAFLFITSFAGYCKAEIENARSGIAQFETSLNLTEPADGSIQDLSLPQMEAVKKFTAESSANPETYGPEVRKKYDYILQKQSPDNLSELNAQQIEFLFYETSNNKIAALSKVPYYDPSGEIGFCFGRAMAAHLLSRRMGLKEQSTGNVFIIGDLKSGTTTEWRFHMTAVVRGSNDDWFAIDPIIPGPMPIRTWIRTIRTMFDKQTRAKIYFTHSDAVLPDVRIFPAPDEEKGELIIELSFDPGNKPGFDPFPADFEPAVFSIDKNAANKYFLNVHENIEADSFDFLGITINGDRYDYRNYFVDLITDLSGQKHDNKNMPAAIGPAAAGSIGKQLFSPRWGTR